MAEGHKDDAGKPRPTLVLRSMANALQQVVQVAEYGAKKYSPDNWLQVPDAEQRYTDAMLRHQQAHLRGERVDPESGLPHMAHAAWCALAVLELMLRGGSTLRDLLRESKPETLHPADGWAPLKIDSAKLKIDSAKLADLLRKLGPGSESSTAALETAVAACPDKRYEQAFKLGLLMAGAYKGLQVMLRLKLKDRTAAGYGETVREALANLREGISHFYDAALTEAVTPAWTVQDALASLRKDPAVAKVLDARTAVPMGWGTDLWLRCDGQTVGLYALADLQKDAALRRRVRRAIKAYAPEVQGQKQAELAVLELTRDEPLLAEAAKRKLLRATFDAKARGVRVSLFDRRGQELLYVSTAVQQTYVVEAVRRALAAARQHPGLSRLLEAVLPRPAGDKDLRRGRRRP